MKNDKQHEGKVKKPIYKKWWFWVIIIIGLLGAIGSNSSKDKETTVQEKEETEKFTHAEITQPLEVFLNVTGHKEGNSVLFDIETNLPDESSLGLTMSKGDYNNGDAYTGHAGVTVLNGRASSDGFSNKGEALSGDFDLVVSMSLPSTQSDSVRAIIGENGENLAGPLIKTSDNGGSKYVIAIFSVNTDGEIIVTPTGEYTHTIFRTENNEEESVEDEIVESSDTQANKEFIEKYQYDFVAASKMALDSFITGYKISLAPQMWTLSKFDQTDTIIGMTYITYNNQKGKYIYVGTLYTDDTGKVLSVKPHYLEVNGQVLGDDGYCKDVFDKIRGLSGN